MCRRGAGEGEGARRGPLIRAAAVGGPHRGGPPINRRYSRALRLSPRAISFSSWSLQASFLAFLSPLCFSFWVLLSFRLFARICLRSVVCFLQSVLRSFHVFSVIRSSLSLLLLVFLFLLNSGLIRRALRPSFPLCFCLRYMSFVKLNPRKYPIFIIQVRPTAMNSHLIYTLRGGGGLRSLLDPLSDPSLSVRPFPSFPRVKRYKPETRKSSKDGAPTEPSRDPGSGGSKRHRPPPSRPQSAK